MTLFKRINDVICANINDLLDRVEDPERMIKQIIREMEMNISNAREGVVEAVASEKQLGKELDSHRDKAEEWRARGEQALRAGNEALAREALGPGCVKSPAQLDFGCQCKGVADDRFHPR